MNRNRPDNDPEDEANNHKGNTPPVHAPPPFYYLPKDRFYPNSFLLARQQQPCLRSMYQHRELNLLPRGHVLIHNGQSNTIPAQRETVHQDNLVIHVESNTAINQPESVHVTTRP
ncbi:hypothetical protein GBA52_010448 [Prunus armeniaca]|nr:hypothetical protein GBA52_010448 [Prunus armeniaca]